MCIKYLEIRLKISWYKKLSIAKRIYFRKFFHKRNMISIALILESTKTRIARHSTRIVERAQENPFSRDFHTLTYFMFSPIMTVACRGGVSRASSTCSTRYDDLWIDQALFTTGNRLPRHTTTFLYLIEHNLLRDKNF